MERLTEYFELGAYAGKRNNIIDISDKLPLFKNGVIIGKLIDRLAEYEDFMEANGFEDIQELQNALNGKFEGFFDEKHKIWINTIARLTKCEQENKALKDRWEKLKSIIEKDVEHNQKEYDESFLSEFQNYSATENWVLDRMEELEKGGEKCQKK